MLRRYAITNAVYQPRQCDVVSLSFISNYQSFGYLHLILRWATSAQIKAYESLRETGQPVDHQLGKQRNGYRVVFQHHYPAGLFCCPLKRAAMIPVRTVVCVINQQMSIQQRSKTLCLSCARVMADHHKLNLFSHQRISNKKAARWRLLSEYQGVASF
ncbi:hypothetical protein ASU64_23450 [Enterobacter hormaechei subsp. hoffmannii]|uniref:Uncharacterized protein n=2 Tax=Enterobacter hormaechei TaxID=158836 RepID=A0A837F9V5_9ENTR|nr:hypothetical protein SS59_25400 [Enterobacter hormaechei subsp. xiangfangensis]KTK28826.1 hypothetical protein ASU64_23450 [Enterobacter hormaechei subsp. hoffmannii]CZX02467.1 Uncharacterised protein [Enterobacter hormaechei]DAL14970.1 MAG TPA_asm: hypothetical protein [Caudoviricetes sp.]